MIDGDSSIVIWGKRYTKSADFQIILEDLAAGGNLSIVVQASCGRMELAIASPIRLAENCEKPARAWLYAQRT